MKFFKRPASVKQKHNRQMLRAQQAIPQSIPPAENQAFTEYTFFIEDTARLSERRQTVTNAYITVNGAIVTVISFLIKDVGFTQGRQMLVICPLLIIGIIICYFWYGLLQAYKRLIGFRFEQLQLMEQTIPGLHGMFTRETDRFYGHAPSERQIHISNIERGLPIVFGLLYMLGFLLDMAFWVILRSGWIN